MHTLTIQTRFTFGDLVSFQSPTQGRQGKGRIIAITVDFQKRIDFIIEVAIGDGGFDYVPGIFENEILSDAP